MNLNSRLAGFSPLCFDVRTIVAQGLFFGVISHMAKTKIQNLAIDLLRLDGGTQARLSIDQDTVDTYFEVLEKEAGEWPFGEIDVFFDGSDYFVADGFHRTLAATRMKRASVPCRVHQGTAKDAKIFGMTANDMHGLRMSRDDKRACVEWLLDNFTNMTRDELAIKAGVVKRTVQRVVAERKGATEGVTKSPRSSETQKKPASKSSDVPPVHPEDSPAEVKRKLRSIIQQHLDRAARAVGDLHEQFPNRAQYNAAVKAIQGINLW